MGGGNAQKTGITFTEIRLANQLLTYRNCDDETATSRARHLAKAENEGKGGGGKTAMEMRKGAGMADAMAEV